MQVGRIRHAGVSRRHEDAEYLVGFAPRSLGPEFYRGAPQAEADPLISAGYDRLASRRRGRRRCRRQQWRPRTTSPSPAHPDADPASTKARLASPQRHHRQVAVVGDSPRPGTSSWPGRRSGSSASEPSARRSRAGSGFDMHVQYNDIVRLTEHAEDAPRRPLRALPELLRTLDSSACTCP